MAKDLPLKLAQDYLKRSLELARAQDMRIAVAVVDRGGHVVASARMDASDPLISRAFEAMDDHLLVLPGGFPVTLVADVVGGFGIAGGHYSQDRAIGERVISQIALEAAE
jgi:glc operon protein GlcG